MNNIAEGFDRQTNQEFKQFLYISKGSCAEVKSMLYLAIDLGYLTSEKSDDCFSLADSISKLLYRLIKSLGAGRRVNQ